MRGFAIAAAGVVAACTPGQVFVDGYPIGDFASCPAACTREIATALHWLDRTSPGHPSVDRVELHVPDYRTPNGSRILAVRSGGRTYVAVFVFADGSRGAIQVGCGIGVDPNPCFTAGPGVAPAITIEQMGQGSPAP